MIWAEICCGQMAGWIKMPLGTEVGLGPGDVVLDGDPAPPPAKGAQQPPLFSVHVYCGHGRPSQLLLSPCLILDAPVLSLERVDELGIANLVWILTITSTNLWWSRLKGSMFMCDHVRCIEWRQHHWRWVSLKVISAVWKLSKGFKQYNMH